MISLKSKGHAWVFGATGLTGRAVLSALHSQEVSSVAHIRPDSPSWARLKDEFDRNQQLVNICPWHQQDLNHAFEIHPPTVVFLCLGTTRKRTRVDGQGYEDVDEGLTRMVIDASSKYPNASICYVSSQPGHFGRYFEIRRRLEAHILEGGNRYLIVRPSFILGNRLDRRPMETLGAFLSDRALDVVQLFGGQRLAEKYQSIRADTLGRGMVQCCLDARWNRIVGPEEIREAANRFKS